MTQLSVLLWESSFIPSAQITFVFLRVALWLNDLILILKCSRMFYNLCVQAFFTDKQITKKKSINFHLKKRWEKSIWCLWAFGCLSWRTFCWTSMQWYIQEHKEPILPSLIILAISRMWGFTLFCVPVLTHVIHDFWKWNDLKM